MPAPDSQKPPLPRPLREGAPRRTLLRRLFQLWFRLSRPLTLGVRALVRDEEGRILLVRHTYAPGWALPGGGVERRETAPQALAKELREEAGIILAPSARPALFGLYSNRAIFPGDHVALYIVAPGQWRRAAWRPTREIAEARFFALSEIPPDATPGTLRRLREVLEGLPPAEDW